MDSYSLSNGNAEAIKVLDFTQVEHPALLLSCSYLKEISWA